MTDEIPQLYVHMNELLVVRSPCVLKTTLGSCVGIAFVWAEHEVFGLAHCLLPASPPGPFVAGARFVDQAVRSLLFMMRLKPEDYPGVAVHLAGGGNMRGRPIEGHVGLQNAEAATTLLRELGLRVVSTDLGGYGARRMVLRCPEGEVTVTRVAAPS